MLSYLQTGQGVVHVDERNAPGRADTGAFVDPRPRPAVGSQWNAVCYEQDTPVRCCSVRKLPRCLQT